MNQLVVAGLGINDLNQMTVETLRWLKKADQVLYLGTTPSRHLPQLKELGVKNITSIFELYKDGDIDDNNYSRLYDATVKSAENNSVCVLLVPGHPRIGVSLVQRLEKARSTNSFALVILPGISSFDTMLNDLARDPLEKGSLVMDSNRVLLFETRWDSSIDCYLYHVCSVGTRNVHLGDAKKENDWSRLKNHLLSIYSPDSPVELVSSSTYEGVSSKRISAKLSELEGLLENVHFGTTLFIPGTKPKRINHQFLNSMLKKVQ